MNLLRKLREADISAAKRTPWFLLFMFWCVVPIAAPFYMAWAFAYPTTGIPIGLVCLFGIFRLSRWTYFKKNARVQESNHE